MLEGTLKFCGLAIAEIEVDFKNSNLKLSAKMALVDRGSNTTLAWNKIEGAVWSKDTISHLEALRASMENDLASRFFQEFSSPSTGASAPPPTRVGGIGEYLATEADQA